MASRARATGANGEGLPKGRGYNPKPQFFAPSRPLTLSLQSNMPVILATPRNLPDVFQSFSDRGYNAWMPCQASDVEIAAIPNNPDPPKLMRLSHLANYVEAQSKQSGVLCGGFFNGVKFGDIPPLTPPVCRVRVTDPSKNEEAVLSLGMTPVAGLKGIYEGSPTFPHFLDILKLGCEETRYQPGTVSVRGYISYFYTIRLVGLASWVSYQTKNSRETFLYDAAIADTFDGGSKKIGYFGSNAVFETVENYGTSCPGKTSMYMIAGSRVLATPRDKSAECKVTTLANIVKLNPTDGHAFEYFRGLFLVDKVFVPQLVQRLFYRILGDDASKAATVFGQIREGWKSLATTSQGEEITHMFFAILLSDMCGCIFTPIINQNRYHGFLAFGDFNLYIRGKEMAPDPIDVLKNFVENTNVHDRRLAEIVAILGTKIDADGSKKYKLQVSDINTSRKLRDYWNSVQISDFDGKKIDEIMEKVDDLHFEDRFAEISRKNICAVIEYARTGEKKLIRDLPSYIKGGALRKRSNLADGLSIFGPRVPSFSYGVGKDIQNFQIPKSEVDADPNLQLNKEKKPNLQYLPYTKVAYFNGITQWDKLLSTGLLRIPQGRPGKKEFTNMSIRDGSFAGLEFPVVYQELRKSIMFFAQKDSVTGKRKDAGDDDDEGRKVKKSKKAAKDNAAMVVDLS